MSERISKVTFETKKPGEEERSKVHLERSDTTMSLRKPVFGFVNFLSLKILFFDIFISIGDVASDFAQGYQLLQTKLNPIYGFITFGIIWLPGIAACVHVISMYRTKFTAKRTLTYAGKDNYTQFIYSNCDVYIAIRVNELGIKVLKSPYAQVPIFPSPRPKSPRAQWSVHLLGEDVSSREDASTSWPSSSGL
jgi:hypothetical protein